MNDLDKKILQQICDKNICPKSGTYFFAMSCIKAGAATALIIFASSILALQLYTIRAVREQYSLGLEKPSLLFNLATLATLLIMAISIGFAVSLIRNLGRSYLYTVTSIAVLVGAVTIVIAHGMDITGANRAIDKYVMGTYLEPFIYHEYDIWMRPQNGKLAGNIEHIISTSSYAIRDLGGNMWIIEEYQHKAATGTKIKIVGRPGEVDPTTLERVFVASATKMWR